MKKLCFSVIILMLLPSVYAQYVLQEEVIIRKDSIEIIRDGFGVPHIYGPTDEEAIYGLMYAMCEDDFKSMQEALFLSKCRNGEYNGVKGATTDYIVQFLRIPQTVEANYDKAFSHDFKRILKAACMAVNKYAEMHPEEILLKDVLPLNEYDYTAGYILGGCFMSAIQETLPKMFDDELPPLDPNKLPTGSNGIAVHKSKTTDGYNYLDINSHQPLEGPYSWYECHVESREGLHMMGAALIGAVTPNIGTNGNIGWTHTINYNDYYDIFKLTMHPTKKDYYKFDGEWKKLEKNKVKLKVKIKGLGKLSVGKDAFWSVYGPVVKVKSGVYALRGLPYQVLGSAEQWYKMCKAENFHQFYNVLKMQQIPCLNIAYADKFDTIFFISNGLYPTERDPRFNWKNVVQGDTSLTLWSLNKVLPIEEIPQLINPNCGYLYSVNQSPFLATRQECNLDIKDYNPTGGWQTRPFNRSIRLAELMDTVKLFNWETFKRIKYDKIMTDTVPFIALVEKYYQIDTVKNPDLALPVRILRSSRRCGEITDTTTALFLLAFLDLQHHVKFDIEFKPHSLDVPIKMYENSLRKAKKHLLKHYGSLYVPLGKVQRLRRGNKDLPLFGLPDVLTPMYSSLRKDGTLGPDGGECYVMLLKIAEKGIHMETIQVYGQSNKPNSKHYTDQMEMFTTNQTKTMTFNQDTIRLNAESITHPK
jgi:acyl-homoserine-lactone acylase